MQPNVLREHMKMVASFSTSQAQLDIEAANAALQTVLLSLIAATQSTKSPITCQSSFNVVETTSTATYRASPHRFLIPPTPQKSVSKEILSRRSSVT